MLQTFTLTVDTETKTAVHSGNIPTRMALAYLQDIVISEEAMKLKEVKDEQGTEEHKPSEG